MKMDKQRLLGIFHRSLMPFLPIFRHFRTFVLVGFENIEEKIEYAVLQKAPHLTGKTVMVTGAGGLVGSEISHQLLQFQPSRIILIGHGPQSISSIEQQLQNLLERHIEIIPIILNVQDKKRLFEIVGRHKPDIIYHTTGKQQRYFTEEIAVESLYGNVFGTKNLAEAARRYDVNTFVMVSSEQATKPRNLTEAVARLAEMIVESVSLNSTTRFKIIRLPENLAAHNQLKKSHRLFEQAAPIVDAAQTVLQAGSLKAASVSENMISKSGSANQGDFQKQAALSQLELARLLKQLKTTPENKARELIISIVKQ
ncbi:NAD-dependent epimerase/dehydratase family protein [Planococcus sp. CPCC 101016]|uniref:polysaccharide biosynthesis protein n=1 Tax=Planococcus sp. CPCC 101016 TaxID=2599617 RepID=UPI0011B7A875|nr:polysaccharide biosynthesis protein [Planococcus sp. CPCC 101016]TWT07191.1 NAD-dependent epimerase/dehydratase family protein [Planococcus sp. CPCC 101016]